MRGFEKLIPFLAAAESLDTNTTQLKSPIPRPIEEAYGTPPKRLFATPKRGYGKSPDHLRVRVPDNCIFPIDLVIIQDATASFEDDYVEMRNRQLKLIVDGITASHPGSRIGITSFKDKPIWSLGDATDYCYAENLPLQPANFTALYNAYEALQSYGGADPAENQLGAMIATAQSKSIGWGGNPLATNLVVVATDAWYHYDLDGLNAYGMTPFAGAIDFANKEAQCLSQYYPSPAQTVQALSAVNAYAGFLLFDPDWASGRPYAAWKWFNEYLGQTNDFITNSTANSANFWDNLAKIIAIVEKDECDISSTVAPTTVPRSTNAVSTPPATVVPSTMAPLSTLTVTRTAATQTLTQSNVPTTDRPTECPEPCPSDNCPCPEVVIKLRQRPEQLHLDVKNTD